MHEGLPEPGDVIAEKYLVERAIGRGGMGAVYCVSHRLTGKRLALKCLLPVHANNPSVVERFQREARAAGRIQHRHVIDVFDVSRDGALHYIVMPLLEGKPLGELFHDERLSLDDALLVLVRAMEGVAAANSVGILHRDLKPGNIFVCQGPSGKLDDPRVLDFGISKLDDELESPLTCSGVAVGTPYYMALEQLTGQRDIDQRVDVYAMGVILYEALVGELPHTAENVAALALRLMHTPPRHLRLARPDLPTGLADAIMRAVARDREERFVDIRALIDAIVPFVPERSALHAAQLDPRPLRTPRETAIGELGTDIARLSQPTEPRQVEHLPAPTESSHAARSSQPVDTRVHRRRLLLAGTVGVVLASLLAFGTFSAGTGAGAGARAPVASEERSRLDASAPPPPEASAPVASPPAGRVTEAGAPPAQAAPARAAPVRAFVPSSHRKAASREPPAPALLSASPSPPAPASVSEQKGEPEGHDKMRADSLAPDEF